DAHENEKANNCHPERSEGSTGAVTVASKATDHCNVDPPLPHDDKLNAAVRERPLVPRCTSSTSSIATQNAGRSLGTRALTMFPSTTAARSTHVAPALMTSSLMPTVDVNVRPRTIPAEMRIQGP